MVILDDIDRHILLELQRDGRLTNQELADRVGLSPSPCLRRVRLLQENGVISGYAAMLSQDALGLSITAFVRMTLLAHTPEVVDAVEEKLRSIPEVVEAYLLAGDDDYLVKIVSIPSPRTKTWYGANCGPCRPCPRSRRHSPSPSPNRRHPFPSPDRAPSAVVTMRRAPAEARARS